MRNEDLTGKLVISRNSMLDQKPIIADCTAAACADELNTWDKFVGGMTREGRGRLQAKSRLLLNGDQVTELEGQFVALNH